MNRHTFKTITISTGFYTKATALFLAFLLLCAPAIAAAATFASAFDALAVQTSEVNYEIVGRVTDPDTSTDTGFLDIPRVHDGRIWTDKSVNPGASDDDFEVTLSALSQSFPITEGYSIPADTVFVIDVSGSMTAVDAGATDTRIEFLVEALNEAIAILHAANSENRVAVVAYGGRPSGYGRVENVLMLGRYTAENDQFFSVAVDAARNTNVIVNAEVADESGGQRVTDSLRVAGSTPTQWGIYWGSQILENADPLVTVPMTDSSGVTEDIVVTRRPNMILMTDGEPTMGWTNYTFDEAVYNPIKPGPDGALLGSPAGSPQLFLGDGSYGELGIGLLTVLTAAHRKQLINEHYFPGGSPAGFAGQPDSRVGFYTIGLGVQPSQGATDLIRAVMNPFDVDPALTNNNADVVTSNIRERMNLTSGFDQNKYQNAADPTMGALLRNFTASSGADISFSAQRRQGWGDYHWEQSVSVANTVGLGIQDIAYTDGFYEAADIDELRDAFTKITTSIQAQSIEMVTNVHDTNPDFDGWLVFSDVLGDYMEFRGGIQLYYGGDLIPRGSFNLENSSIRADYEKILLEQLNYGTPEESPLFMQPGDVSELIAQNIAAGNTNSITYYVDTDRNYVGFENPGDAAAHVEVFPMIGGVTRDLNRQANLMYVTFHVVTALRDDAFNEVFTPPAQGGGTQVPTVRNLREGDQIVRWYIPASIIPMRSVDVTDGTVGGDTEPIRVQFIVGLNHDQIANGIHKEYIDENAAADGELYFYSNDWHNNQNVTLAFDQPHEKNPYYQPGGVGYDIGRSTVIKAENSTETHGHVSLVRSTAYDDNRITLQWLGNNGRLTLDGLIPENPPPPVDPPPEDSPPPVDPPPVDPPPPADPPGGNGDTPPPASPPPADSPERAESGPKTADNSNPSVHVLLMAVSLIAIVTVVYRITCPGEDTDRRNG